jgi:hypothetical protein
MYTEFFKLRVKPFELVPNPEFLYLSKAHRKALSFLEYGLNSSAGFILLTGDIGSGKTTIIRSLLDRLESKTVPARIFNTKADAKQLLFMINEDFGLCTQPKDKMAMLSDLNEFLVQKFANNEKPVLIIDEAQNLSPDCLEEVRLLSNLESNEKKLLQIILVGQPELKTLLLSQGCNSSGKGSVSIATLAFCRQTRPGSISSIGLSVLAMSMPVCFPTIALHWSTRSVAGSQDSSISWVTTFCSQHSLREQRPQTLKWSLK